MWIPAGFEWLILVVVAMLVALSLLVAVATVAYRCGRKRGLLEGMERHAKAIGAATHRRDPQ